jgi:hypothetical protein
LKKTNLLLEIGNEKKNNSKNGFISDQKHYSVKHTVGKLFHYYNLASSGGEEGGSDGGTGRHSMPLAQSLLNAVADLLFCPEFTVAPNKKSNRDEVDDLQVCIWPNLKLNRSHEKLHRIIWEFFSFDPPTSLSIFSAHQKF